MSFFSRVDCLASKSVDWLPLGSFIDAVHRDFEWIRSCPGPKMLVQLVLDTGLVRIWMGMVGMVGMVGIGD